MNSIVDYVLSKSDLLISASLVVITFCLILYIIYHIASHYLYLVSLDEDELIDTEYASYSSFRVNFKNLLKYTIRKYIKYYKFTLHYLHFYIIKSLSFVQHIINSIYAKLRNNFVEKSIGDKKYVAHFWGNLKEFKKEMDKE